MTEFITLVADNPAELSIVLNRHTKMQNGLNLGWNYTWRQVIDWLTVYEFNNRFWAVCACHAEKYTLEGKRIS